MAQDKELLQNLKDTFGTLPCKKPKSKAKKLNPMSEHHKSSLANIPSGCETPLTRKRRNSFDSINGLSAKRTTTVSELKFVVSNLESEVAEIINILKSDNTRSLLEDKISCLEDKIAQIANSSKINYQSLVEKTKDLKLENQSLRNENTNIKSELQNLKKILKAQEKQQQCTDQPVKEIDTRDKNDETPVVQIPDDIPIGNKFSILGEGQEEPTVYVSSTPEQPTAIPEPNKSNVQDDIVLLVDSNGKFIDPHKFSYNKRLRKLFCPTIASAAKEIRDSDLGTPSHVIIHAGTNDIETNTVEVCQSQFQDLLQLTAQRYPTSKVLLSSLLKRSDDKGQSRSDLNAELGQICVPYPNVHIVKNDNISEDHLFDNKHLKKTKIGLLVWNLKDVIFNRMRQNKPKQKRPLQSQSFPGTSVANPTRESRQHHHDASLSSGPVTRPRFQAHPSGLPSQPTVNMYRHGHGDQPSYAAIVNKPPSVPTAQTGFQPSATVDLNTVLGLLKLYESLRNQ